MDWSPDGQKVASGGKDNAIRGKLATCLGELGIFVQRTKRI